MPLLSDPSSDADTGGAVIGSTEYASVSEALAASVSGDVVFLVPDSEMHIHLGSDATVKKGVRLVLQYSEKKNASGTEDGGEKAEPKIADNDYRYLVFRVEPGATLNVEGELVVGGVLSKKFTFDYQGHTSGNFARMQISGTVNIADGGRLYCYGSIIGGGTLSLQDGAEVYEPLVVTDYVGGDSTYVAYENGQSFFNRYAVPNIQCKFSMTSGATVFGLLNLYADSKYNKVVLPLVSDSEGLIILSKGATLTSSYNANAHLTAYTRDDLSDAEKDKAWASNIYPDIDKKYIRITGGASFGKIVPSFQGRQADSSKTIFSVPYNFDITLLDGSYLIDKKIRFLPGSRLAVAKGADLTVTGALLVYDGLFDKAFRDKYYPTTEILGNNSQYYSKIAGMIVNGTLNIKGTFTGLVQCTASGGTVSIDPGATLFLKEQPYGAKGKMQGRSELIDNLSKMDLRAFAMDGYGKEFDLVAGKTYTSFNSSEHVLASYKCYSPETGKLVTIALDQAVNGSWSTGTFSVRYSANGGTGEAPKDLNRYEAGEYASILGQNGLSKDGYRFTGWSTSSKGAGTVYVQGQKMQVNSNVTLYAVWKALSPVTGVVLDKTSAAIDVGGSVTLKATVSPSDATNKTVSWSTSSPKVATVSNGKVTGVSAGKATITATTVDGGFKATCVVTVQGPVVVKGVTLDKTSAAIDVGGSVTLKATVSPSDATNKTVSWSTSSPKVATVSNGKVTGLSAGKATITATTADGGYKATCVVTVSAPLVKVTGITISKSSLSLKEGESASLVASVIPSNATNKAVSWSSEDSGIATVVGGVVTGKSVGTTTVTATSADGGFSKTCEVTVVSSVVKVTGVKFKDPQVTMAVGKTQMLSYEVLPADATDTEVTWKSSDPSVVSVSFGVLTSKSEGRAAITVTTKDGGFSDTCEVVVERSVIEVTGISLDRHALEMKQGTDDKLIATVLPSDATNRQVIWYSMNLAVVTVDSDGNLHAVSSGVTDVQVATSGGEFKDSCQVKVTKAEVPVSSVLLDDEFISMEAGETAVLKYTVLPVGASWKSLEWSSSDSSVAAVKDGTVTGVSAGTASITLAVDGVQDVCTVVVTDRTVPVESVVLDKSEATLSVGSETTLIATVLPSNATYKTVQWETSDSSVATVSDGTVVAVSEGVATITAKTMDGHEGRCVVTVVDDAIEVTGVSLDKTDAAVHVGEILELHANVAPAEATNKSVRWYSSDPDIASVDGGTVSGVSAGSVVITVITYDGGYSASCNVDVLPPVIHVTSVSLDKTSVTMKVGDSSYLSATILPPDASDRSLVWSSSDSRVVSVSGGSLKAITPGTATITVTAEGGVTAACEVTVEPLPAGDGNALLYAAIAIGAVLAILAVVLLMRRKTI